MTTTTALIEVHGNDGSSRFTAAKTAVLKEHPNAEIVETQFSGDRCRHGALLVAVTFHEREE